MALDTPYWALARTGAGYRAELAGLDPVEDWEDTARRLLNAPDSARAMIVTDPGRGSARVALFDGDRLIGALFVAREPVAVMRDYLATLPGSEEPGVLSGRPAGDRPDPGPILCSCFGVGVNTIVTAIETQGLATVGAIGEALQAGTNCGSCRPEIAAILARVHQQEAAE
jgi:assimilatory nitrate reductase catalytic subunit